MIQRIYIDHYRLFENLEIDLQGKHSILLIGRNGVGKSSLGRVLSMLQQIGRGNNRLSTLFGAKDFGRADTTRPIRIELEVKIGSQDFRYVIAVELPPNSQESIVREEKLQVDGKSVISCNPREVSLEPSAEPFLIDRHSAALPIVEVRGDNAPITKFKDWLAKMIIISLDPSRMGGVSDEKSLEPEFDCSNFASWFSGLLNEYPASYAVVEKYLRTALPDFQDFQNEPISEVAKRLFVRFSDADKKPLRLDFKNLSDGEKCFFVCSVVLGANKFYGPVFCLWDEPDNYLSLSEVGHLVMALRRSFEKSGQLLVTSHNPEAIRKFSDENTLVLDRKSHLVPPTAHWLNETGYNGDLVESLIRGEFSGGSE